MYPFGKTVSLNYSVKSQKYPRGLYLNQTQFNAISFKKGREKNHHQIIQKRPTNDVIAQTYTYVPKTHLKKRANCFKNAIK